MKVRNAFTPRVRMRAVTEDQRHQRASRDPEAECFMMDHEGNGERETAEGDQYR